MHKLAATFFSISMGVVLAACGDSSATGGSTGNGTGGAGNGTGTSTNNGGTGGLGSTGSFMDGSTGTQRVRWALQIIESCEFGRAVSSWRSMCIV